MISGILPVIQKKGTRMAMLQQIENRKAVLRADYNGIMGGVDSFMNKQI